MPPRKSNSVTATRTKVARPSRKADSAAKEKTEEGPAQKAANPVAKPTAASKQRKTEIEAEGAVAKSSHTTKTGLPRSKTTAIAAKEPDAVPPGAKSKTPKRDESDKENNGKPPTQAKANTKRKREHLDAQAAGGSNETERGASEAEGTAVPAKRAKQAAGSKNAIGSKPRAGKHLNDAPTALLDIFVFGEGSAGELGLGSKKVDGKKPIDVKRPRLNTNLSARDVGVVQVACGGMHVVALTKDNTILTWGVNDQGALGRDTTWDGGVRDVDDEDSDDEDSEDTGMNPRESTPTKIDTTNIGSDVKFVQVVASDSASFALTEQGRVYGWGTFRNSDGILGFTENILIQKIPMLLTDVKDIRQLAAGSNHILALDNKGKVQAWGCGQQNQLGRKVFEREIKLSLRPVGIGNLPIRGAKPQKVACGSYHSFVIDQHGRVYAWGLNNYAELGIEDQAGEDHAAQLKPRLVTALGDYEIADIAGGVHHSLACTSDGRLLTWGRIDGHQVGLPQGAFNEQNAIFDEHGKPRILKEPTVVTAVSSVVSVAAGADHSFALTDDGKAYSWGFSATYQTGQGKDDDVEAPTLIDNTAVRDKHLIFAGAGGQYSVLASASNSLSNGTV